MLVAGAVGLAATTEATGPTVTLSGDLNGAATAKLQRHQGRAGEQDHCQECQT